MKKTLCMMALAAGITGIMMVAGGCGGQKAQEMTSAETSDEAADGGEAETADLSVPVHIWGTVVRADERGIMVDNQSENSAGGEMLLRIDPETTYVVDAVQGLPVETENISQGSFHAYLGPAMSMSLPPQVTPYMVIVNIPEDYREPQFAISAGKLQEKDGGKVLTANDGSEYVIAGDVEIIPYLTRNIVSLEDIGEGSRVLMWLHDDDDSVAKIVLFAE